MSEQERMNDLFKEEQISRPSIHLHAFSYSVGDNHFLLLDSRLLFPNRVT